MGRWTVHKHHPNEKFFFVTDADTCVISNLTKSEADAIADAHNADCDAYEARIAELEAALNEIREVVPQAVNSKPYDVEHLRGTIWHILYTKEKPHDH